MTDSFTGTWATDTLIANKFTGEFTIPASMYRISTCSSPEY
jgi:hypothetical protein